MEKFLQELLTQVDIADPYLSCLQQIKQRLIESDLGHNYQVNEFATHLCMSERNLRRKCQKLFGKSPAEIITLYRMEKAKELLASGKSVSDVSHQLKYSSPSHFSKVFKEMVGVRPSGFKIKDNKK